MHLILSNIYIAVQALSQAPAKNTAYLDPGSGSFIFQLIIASILGGLILVKAYWKRISGFFQKMFARHSEEDEE